MTMLLALMAALGPAPQPPALVDQPAASMAAAPDQPAVPRMLPLSWTGKVDLSVESSPEEVVVRFDRPLPEDRIKAFAAAAGALLGDLRWNDTSLVMRPADGLRIEASAVVNRLEVRFLSDPEAAPQELAVAPATEREPAVELALARARADAASGFTGHAHRSLLKLARERPGDVEIQRSLADLEAADGYAARAAARYRQLSADDFLARRTMAEAGGVTSSGAMFRSGKDFSQREVTVLASRLALGPSLSLGGGFRHIDTRSDLVAGANGVASDIHSRLTLASLSGEWDLSYGRALSFQAASLLGTGVTGASARLSSGPPEGQWRVMLAYRLPDLSTAEQAAFGGLASRIGVGGTLRLSAEMVGQADVALNSYGLAGNAGRTRSVTVSGGVDHLIRRGSPTLALDYRLDAEYVGSQDRRADGLAFVPLSSRENHTLQLVASMPLSHVQLTSALGWTKDRIGGGGGPSANLGAVALLGARWRIEGAAGISSVSRPSVAGRQLLMRATISRSLKGL